MIKYVKLDKFLRERFGIEHAMLEVVHDRPADGQEIMVLDHGEMVAAKFADVGSDGFYIFTDWDNWRSVYKTDGWANYPASWFIDEDREASYTLEDSLLEEETAAAQASREELEL